MFGQKDGNTDQTDGSANGPAPVASAATDPSASVVDNSAWQHPGPPPSDADANPDEPAVDVISPAGGFPNAPSNKITPGGDDTAAEDPQVDAQVSQAADDLVSQNDVANGDLVELKQKALHELAPLIDQLNLPPEDKFRTVMMMIQASDDQTLVEKAYEVAHSIEDEHARAQALLDIVNEINYFTQPQSDAEPQA